MRLRFDPPINAGEMTLEAACTIRCEAHSAGGRIFGRAEKRAVAIRITQAGSILWIGLDGQALQPSVEAQLEALRTAAQRPAASSR